MTRNTDAPLDRQVGAAASRAEALKRELGKTYRLRDADFLIRGHTFTVTLVDNTSEMLDRLAAGGPHDPDVRDERLPYWATLWRSSLVMAEWLMERLEPGAELVELGSGLGFCTAISAWLGARVTATDYQPDALRFTTLNCLKVSGHAPVTRLMDWRAPDPTLKHDLVIGSDLAYEARFYDPLIDTFDALLNPGGTVYFAEANREIARPFFPRLQERGWRCLPVRETPGSNIYEITRRQP